MNVFVEVLVRICIRHCGYKNKIYNLLSSGDYCHRLCHLNRKLSGQQCSYSAPYADSPNRCWKAERITEVKFDFSAQFMRVNPPDTSFGDAWESLCYALLDAELCDSSLIRLRAPDNGVDILHRSGQKAFQCKSTEMGAFGSLSADESTKSLTKAFSERGPLGWKSYAFATNASYTGSAYTSIKKVAEKLGIQDDQLDFLGPEHWDKLCTRHISLISDRFDYRIPVAKSRVIQAFENQRYFPKYVTQYDKEVEKSELVVRVSNNRTPVVLEIPFSPELTVKHLVDVLKDVLGVSLDWTNYQDLGTSAGSSISLALNQQNQVFDKKIGELGLAPDQELQFWITIVWRDERRRDAEDASDRLEFLHLSRRAQFALTNRDSLTYGERKTRTIERSEEIIESMLWIGARKLKSG